MMTDIQLQRVTVAVNDMPAMVKFYNTVFDAGLAPVKDTPFFAGALTGLRLVFCPNDITQIDAQKNRQQFHFQVDDLDEMIARVRVAGGRVQNDAYHVSGRMGIGVADPDGNTLEFFMLVDSQS